MSALEKLKKNSTIKESSIITKSEIYNDAETDFVPTDVPMINVALSADVDGGLSAGHTMLAGPSKHFKSMFGLLLVEPTSKNIKTPLFYSMITSLEHRTPISSFSILIRNE